MSLVNGSKASAAEVGEKGDFKRVESGFRARIGPQEQYPSEAGRYHLYIAYGCPWANRCLAVLKMKGLEDCVGLSIVHPLFQRTKPDSEDDQHVGWTFANPGETLQSQSGVSFTADGSIPDTVNGVRFIRDLYEISNDKIGKYSVPVLWDKKTSTIVNNESAEIVRIFNAAFDEYAKNPQLDLYPAALQKDIDSVNEWVYSDINNGVYKCGFAQAQGVYDEAFSALFAALDKVEGILSKQRYLVGDVLTEADVRLFMTLIRFDEAYVVLFKTNRNFIHEFPNMSNYVKELFQIKEIGDSINIEHMKTSYFGSLKALNTYGIIPKGGSHWWKQAHDRDTKFPAKATHA